jgi:phosphatidylglycerophosphate synthase
MKKIVNTISAFRLFAGFFVMFLAFTGSWPLAFYLILAGFLSDLIDGPLARKFKVETKGGKALDLSADILFDECIIGVLFLLGKISLPMEIVMAVAIVCLRFPVIFESKKMFRVGVAAWAVYSPAMLWLIGKHYALPALGSRGLAYLIALAVPVGLLIAFLKRERIVEDLSKTRKAFGK